MMFDKMILLLVCIVAIVLAGYRILSRRQSLSPTVAAAIDFKTNALPTDPYLDIEPLIDFDLASTPVPDNAVFKPKYHLTMALEQSTLSDLIAMDHTYLTRMRLRQEILDQNRDVTVRCNEIAQPAVFELYRWMFGVYLPRRFPTVYRLVNHPAGGSLQALYNQASDVFIPTAPPSDPLAALRTLGIQIDTDFILLLPTSRDAEGAAIYHLHAFVNPCPSGFNLSEKLGLPLSGVHGGVPGYQARLARSMDKTFARLERGKLIRRSNWTITTNDRLLNLGGTHLYGVTEAEEAQRQVEVEQAKVKIEECRLRSERQTLFRLPESGAIVFSFKTYLYTLEEVKRRGHAAALAEAIEGLGRGNVPEFEYYKRKVIWGPKVLEYLRT